MSKTDLFQERRVVVERPRHHYCFLEAENGQFLRFQDSKFNLTSDTDDFTIWDRTKSGSFRHVQSGVEIQTKSNSSMRVVLDLASSQSTNVNELADASYRERHGPARMPSEYLQTIRDDGWVCLACILDPDTLDGLEWVACTDQYADRKGERGYALCQHPAVARTAAEPVSLWVIRQYMGIPDVRLSHAPAMAVLSKDDGQRNVQGWHSDFPYHWGTGHIGQIPAPTGQAVLGVQRNVCVSEFTKDRGATAFKLGSHALDKGPPTEWGTAQLHARPGYRAKHGLPYNGVDADIVEAPGGSIILYDSRTWHRAGVNRTEQRRAAMLQAMTPMYVFPKNDTSVAFRAFRESAPYQEVTERERNEIENLMVHQFIGPGGQYAIAPDRELTESLNHVHPHRSGY